MVRCKNPRRRSEDSEQIYLMQWAANQMSYHRREPEWQVLDLLFHIPNGGARSKAEGGIFKAMGVKAGVPDLFLPAPGGCINIDSYPEYHGLFIEMKAEDGRPTATQKQWLTALSKQGYACAVCYGADEAKEVITEYIELRFSQREHTW